MNGRAGEAVSEDERTEGRLLRPLPSAAQEVLSGLHFLLRVRVGHLVCT